MGISVDDIKRALLGGGDVFTFVEVCRKALGDPPIRTLDSLETAVALPETTALLKHIDKDLERLVVAWIAGRASQPPSGVGMELTLICLAPCGRNTASHLERIIEEVKPDVIAIDTPPLDLSASMLYALSIPCGLGLPVWGEIAIRGSGQPYVRRTFYPGDIGQTAIVRSWLKKTPLLPVGMPRRQPKRPETDLAVPYADGTYADLESSEASMLEAHRALDESLERVTGLQESLEISRDVCLRLMKTVDSRMRDTLVGEACYIASRVMEIAAYASAQGRKARLLAAVNIEHYLDVEYITGLLKRGLRDEVYVPPRSCALAEDMVMTARYSDELNERAEEYALKATLAQELFQSQLDKLIETRGSEALTESTVDRLIAQIAGRTRAHPGITRGASVRGTIAFKEVLQALSEIKGAVTRDTIGKAAMITLPPRVVAKRGSNETAIVNDIVKEALYDMRFSSLGYEPPLPKAVNPLSPDDMMKSLDSLEGLSREQSRELPPRKPPTVIAEQDKNRGPLKRLEPKDFQNKRQQSRRSSSQKASEHLIDELARKLSAGEITPADYDREKTRLEATLKSASPPQFRMSARELASTIMELMEAQDRQRSSDVTFERMHVYYHIKANSAGSELGPQKRDYYALRTLIDGLQKEGILRAVETGEGLTLTSRALNILLDYLINRDRGLKGAVDSGKTPANERKPEIRRYSSGDVFRDISFRHTLREIARQKKDLSSVRRGDFRVFLKQRRKRQSDIVLCLDTSGSMSFQRKLVYARLAAAGLARAAVENGDRVGVVAFNNLGQTTMPLTGKDAGPVLDCIARLSGHGNTNVADGIKCSSDLLSQEHNGNQKYIVLITDGRPTAISERTFDRLRELGEKDLTEESAILETRKASTGGVRVSVVHIASDNEVNEGFIRSIARAGRGKVYHLSGAGALGTLLRAS